MSRIAIVGASGRMGRCLVKAVAQQQVIYGQNVVSLGAVVSNSSLLFRDQDAGELVQLDNKLGILVINDLTTAIDEFDVLIDFTIPDASMKYLKLCRQAGKKLVIGTTGFTDAQKAEITKAAEEIAIVFAPNFSVGVNLSLKLLEMTAKVMGEYSDIEIIEAHHRYKIDAPSGTALRMGEIIANALGDDLNNRAVYDRAAIRGERKSGSIGFASIRGGDIAGEHTVMFINDEERVEITHKASSRMTFAHGAVRAAVWLADKKTGLYDMQDVLGLS
jgi:4-hydroxy-tetrahydrodipicolinate reductase